MKEKLLDGSVKRKWAYKKQTKVGVFGKIDRFNNQQIFIDALTFSIALKYYISDVFYNEKLCQEMMLVKRLILI